MIIELPRRKFLAAAATLFCAPAIVRASSLMPVRARRLKMLPLQYDVRTIRVYFGLSKIRDRNMLLPADAYYGLSLVR